MQNEPSLLQRRAILLAAALLLTFALLRLSLYVAPNTNLDVAGYNIHHLFSGILLIVVAGLPLMMMPISSRGSDLATVVFGAGLSMVLDEWLYLICTDGSDNAYWLPVSWWGALLMMSLVCVYIVCLCCWYNKKHQKR